MSVGRMRIFVELINLVFETRIVPYGTKINGADYGSDDAAG